MNIETKLYKRLGKLTLSSTGLRRMASWLELYFKTKGDVEVKASIQSWKEGKKLKKTFGIEK